MAGSVGGLGRATSWVTSWGPRPGHALGDELRRRCGGQAGERAQRCRGACRRGAHGRALSGGSSQGSTLCHTGARAGAGGGGCLLAAVCWMRGHAMPTGGGT